MLPKRVAGVRLPKRLWRTGGAVKSGVQGPIVSTLVPSAMIGIAWRSLIRKRSYHKLITQKEARVPASYSLGKHFQTFVQRQVQSGRFASASEVVREGLRLMEEREAEREVRLQALRAEIARGAESGPGIPATEVFAEARERIARDFRQSGGR